MCMPEPITAKLGVFGRIIDPGLATSELIGKVAGERVGNLFNPGKFLAAFEPPKQKAPTVIATPEPDFEAEVARKVEVQEEVKRRRSLINSDPLTPDPVRQERPGLIGAQRLDTSTGRDRKTLLGE